MTNKSELKKQIDDILDQLLFECYKVVELPNNKDAMSVVKQSLSNINNTKRVTQGYGQIDTSKVQFQIGKNETIPLFSEVDDDNEN